MRTYFGDLSSVLEDLVDQVADDVNLMTTEIKAARASVSARQRAALEAIRDETHDLDALVTRLIGPSPAIKSMGGFASADVVTNVGGAIKALGSGAVGGYLVRFNTPDITRYRDTFLKSTYYGRSKKVDAYLHHAMLDTPHADQPLTNEAELGMDDVGITVKLVLDLRSKYEKALHDLVEQNKLGWSSGAPAHLVRRSAQKNGTHIISRWPIAEASLTPSPGSGGGTEARAALKSLLLDAVSQAAPAEAPAVLMNRLQWTEQRHREWLADQYRGRRW